MMAKRRQVLSKDELSTPLIANLAQHDESAQHIPQPSNSDDVPEETSPPHLPADIEQPVDPLRFITVPTPRDAQYRANDLRLANILVDEPWDPAVDDHIARHVFTTTENYNDVDHIRLVAERLWHSSFLLAQRPALLQAEWDLSIVWRRDLEPVHCGPFSPPIQNQRSIEQIPDRAGNSISPTRTGEPSGGGFELGCSHPYLTVGLAERILAQGSEHKRSSSDYSSMLSVLQESSALITDPHATPLRIHFPFLILETTSHVDGSLYQAQNKAALCGSRAIRIMEAFSDYHKSYSTYIEESSLSYGTPDPDGLPVNLAFSVTTQGPHWELWVHYRRATSTASNSFVMVCIRSGMLNIMDDCLVLVRHLFDIMKWGSVVFAAKIKTMLREIDIA
ncbi:hypothetical protein AbraIFM66950_009228 [Aspergillus brasiliensis]|nr:hypothetical protein AbraIFM66950_009228 [Aspergillus brasiliensis]